MHLLGFCLNLSLFYEGFLIYSSHLNVNTVNGYSFGIDVYSKSHGYCLFTLY